MLAIRPLILLALLADPKPPEPEVKTLRVSPAALPSPLLKYRLLPLESELQPGDAAPMYLRINGELGPLADELRKKPQEWYAMPADKLPVNDVRNLVLGAGSRLEQIGFAARRQTCTWNYSLPEQRTKAIEILLPDVQQLATWLRVVSLKARLEVLDGKYDDAIRTMETGLAASRHIAGGPFLVNGLVGVGSARNHLMALEELLDRPDAPNLYWALTALPRPLIDLRTAFAHESRMLYWVFPDLADLDASRTDGEWSARLARFHSQLLEWSKKEMGYRGGTPNPPRLPAELATLDAFRAWGKPLARAFVGAKFKGKAVGDDHAILLYVSDQYFQFHDQAFTATYVPYTESGPIVAETLKRGEALAKTPLKFFANPIENDFVNVAAGLRASIALDRKVAALRVVEAIRLFASETGKLPSSLDEIKSVPVPANPATGKPFEYRLEGDTAVLHAPMPEGKGASLVTSGLTSLTYRITLR